MAISRRRLVLGGARSGKSRHAEDLLPSDGNVTYLATGRRRADDPEWSARIDAHRARRPAGWRTIEEHDVAAVVRGMAPGAGPLLVDDLTTWLTGVMDDVGAWEGGAEAAVAARVAELVDAVDACAGQVVLVSAEVGLGVVPPTRAGRLFRDELGALNASLATVCDDVVLLVAGLPLVLKGSG